MIETKVPPSMVIQKLNGQTGKLLDIFTGKNLIAKELHNLTPATQGHKADHLVEEIRYCEKQLRVKILPSRMKVRGCKFCSSKRRTCNKHSSHLLRYCRSMKPTEQTSSRHPFLHSSCKVGLAAATLLPIPSLHVSSSTL